MSYHATTNSKQLTTFYNELHNNAGLMLDKLMSALHHSHRPLTALTNCSALPDPLECTVSYCESYYRDDWFNLNRDHVSVFFGWFHVFFLLALKLNQDHC